VRTIKNKPVIKSELTQFKATKEEQPLFLFLAESMPAKSRTTLKSILRNRLVSVNGTVQSHVNFQVKSGDNVVIGKKTQEAIKIPIQLDIVFEDNFLIVVNKPEGVLTMSTDKEKSKTMYAYLSSYVKQKNPDAKIFIVHRLDRETSGLLIFAKSMDVKTLLQNNWNSETKHRKYVALVEGLVPANSGTIQSYLRESKALKVHSSKNVTYGKEAITHYTVIGTKKNSTLLEVILETGRKNQIRVHMEELGHPIVGDTKYGAKTNAIGRLGLHAIELSFKHPITAKLLSFKTALPNKFGVSNSKK
jgi:23S rRNA pseudouridine1911/1915/1917 synthase